ncbi:MAG: hypothetical protein OXI69_16320 [Acidobacteriota bacterium]|nr:hypothetical protein [Acidobacteriota bacterium]
MVPPRAIGNSAKFAQALTELVFDAATVATQTLDQGLRESHIRLAQLGGKLSEHDAKFKQVAASLDRIEKNLSIALNEKLQEFRVQILADVKQALKTTSKED